MITLFSSIILLSVLLGYYISENYFSANRLVKIWDAELRDGQEKIARVMWESEVKIDSLAKELGKIRYEISLMDILILRLAKLGPLDISDYKKDQKLLLNNTLYKQNSKHHLIDLSQAFRLLNEELDLRRQELDFLYSILTKRQLEQTSIPKGWPVARDGGYISSYYGLRVHPITKKYEFHKGIDFATIKAKSDIYAVAAGIVIRSDYSRSYGNVIEIDHGSGYVSKYAHNAKLYVPLGATVYRGQPIAQLGNTGLATGPHVHFEILKNGKNVDPFKYIGRSVAQSNY